MPGTQAIPAIAGTSKDERGEIVPKLRRTAGSTALCQVAGTTRVRVNDAAPTTVPWELVAVAVAPVA